MSSNDTCVSVAPYFQIHAGKLTQFQSICERFVAQSAKEPDCLYYGFSFNDHLAHCREGFKDAQALLSHIENLAPIVTQMTEVSDLVKIEVHGIESELEKLRQPLAGLNPEYFVLKFGFRNSSPVND